MRKVPCFNPSCWSRRVHHERPDDPRGQVMCEVPDNWDGYAAFCSMMCAIEAGYMSLSIKDAPCKKCFVASKGENFVHHHGTWKCVKPELVDDDFSTGEQKFQDLWREREERLQKFRDKIEKKCPRCGSKGTQEERQFGMYVTSCVGCWLPYVDWDTWKESDDRQIEVGKIRKEVQ